MKNLFFLLILLFASTAKAQEKAVEKPKIHHEIGVNTTLLLKQIINFGDTKIAISPYAFTYKMLKNNKGLRFGIGMNLSSINERQLTFADNKTNLNQNANLRLGFEMQRAINSKWNTWVGFDAVANYTNNTNINDSGFDRVSIGNRTKGAGMAIALGAEWRFNKHFSIATEANLAALYNIKDDTVKFYGGTQEDIGKTSKGYDIITQMPSSFFVVYQF